MRIMKRFGIIILSVIILCSCENKRESPVAGNEGDILNTITVARSPMKAAEGTGLMEGESEPLSTNHEFGEGDLLYISQKSRANAPDFTVSDENSNLYIYQYFSNLEEEVRDWENGYNFKSISGRDPISWESVKNFGADGNTFSFFAMAFPKNNEVKFEVKTDQRGDGDDQYSTTNFLLSDILGAYHATSSLYTRLRFRLFHLMVYLKVTLYVPVYSDISTDPEYSYSGFRKGDVKQAEIVNAYSKFKIDWNANRSSDTEAPLTNTDGNKGKIIMYMHDPNFKNDDEGEDIILLNLENFYNGKEETDQVRAYNFSVLFPNQIFSKDDKLIKFTLTSPDDQVKYYYFSGSQIKSGDYALGQGTLQQLYLYLPRSSNQTILIGAKILPWGDSSTEMTVVKQPNGEDTGEEETGGNEDD